MTRMTLRESLTRALAQAPAQTLRASLLSRGTNSRAQGPKTEVKLSREEFPNSGSGPRPARKTNRKPYLGDFKVDINLPSHTQSPEYREGLRRAMLNLPNLAPAQAIKASRHYQAISGQAETVERHMNLTKPVTPRHAPTEKTPDPYLAKAQGRNFIEERRLKVDINLARLREDGRLRARIQALVNAGEVE